MQGLIASAFSVWMLWLGPDLIHPRHQLRFGPPPPGYERITGEPVPGWSEADALRGRSAMNWSQLGPRPIEGEYWSGDDDASGRVVSIAPHPTDAGTAFIASASGGIWRTADGAISWTPVSDELPILNHGCVAIDPSAPDTVYAGTGEYTTLSTGDGMFRSVDAGASWVRVATAADVGDTCSKIIVDPTDPSTIHVTGADGYARTSDGGASWSLLLAGRASDLAVDPSGTTVYVAVHNVGIFKSTDGGSTFSQSTVGLPGGGFSRIVMTMAPSAPSTLYAALVNGGNIVGLYRTIDAAATWSQLPATPNFAAPQAWYDTFVAVDPTDPATVYAGGVFPTYAVAGVIKTTDGGSTWTDITCPTGCTNGTGNPHPDMHTMAFGADGRLWLGNDGGVWTSADGGASWNNTNRTFTLTQNYTIALHPSDPSKMMTGTQDNGTVARDTGMDEWPQIVAGDGGYLAYDFTDPDTRYTTYVYLTVFRLVGGSIFDITGPWGSDPANFIAPLVMDPNDSSTLLGGTHRIWRTQNADGAASWTAISPPLGSTVNAIAVAEGEPDSIYAGTSGGKVWTTTDGAFWLDSSSGLPAGSISDLTIHPADSAVAYVAFFNTSGPRVLRTEDRGASWQDVTGSYPPGAAARALAVEWRDIPPALYVGSGAGVYWSQDHGVTWDKDGTDLPNVNIGDLVLDPDNLTLTAGTYGRGAWRADLSPPTMIFSDGFESGDTSAWSRTVP
jgi:photosystem II stability/assembly factor-like uncharacterized protein